MEALAFVILIITAGEICLDAVAVPPSLRMQGSAGVYALTFGLKDTALSLAWLVGRDVLAWSRHVPWLRHTLRTRFGEHSPHCEEQSQDSEAQFQIPE